MPKTPTYHIHLKERDLPCMREKLLAGAYALLLVAYSAALIAQPSFMQQLGIGIEIAGLIFILACFAASLLFLLHNARWQLDVDDGEVYRTGISGRARPLCSLSDATYLKIFRRTDISVYSDERKLFEFSLDMAGDVEALHQAVLNQIEQNANTHPDLRRESSQQTCDTPPHDT